MKLGFSLEEQRRWVALNRERIEERTGAPVLAFSTFYRTGSWGAMGAQRVSPLAASAIKFIGKRKAAGLPPHFILALTDERLHAFAYKARRDVIEVGDEVGVWERAGIRASVEETAITMRLKLESPADGTKVVCDTGKAEITDEFMAELGVAAAVAA